MSWIMQLIDCITVFKSELEKSFIFRPTNLVESKTWRLWSKNFSSRAGARKFFGPLVGGRGGMLPQKILKISVLRLAENAFPTF